MRRRTADVRIFKSSSVIIWSDPKGAELHVITEDDLKSEISGSVRTLEITYSNYPEWLSSSVKPTP